MARPNSIPLGFVVTNASKAPSPGTGRLGACHRAESIGTMAIRTMLTTTAPVLIWCRDKSSLGQVRKTSGTMIEVVKVSLVFLSAIVFVAHAFDAFRMR